MKRPQHSTYRPLLKAILALVGRKIYILAHKKLPKIIFRHRHCFTLHIPKSYQETTPYFEIPQSLYLKYPRFSWFHRQLLSWNLLPIFQRNLLYARNNLNLDLIWLKIEKRNLILGKTNFQSCKENKIPTSWSLHVLKIMNWRK